MTSRRGPWARLLAPILVTLALVLGAAACSGDDGVASVDSTPETTAAPATTVAPDPTEVVVATATVAELEVLAEPPAGVTDPSPPTTLVAPPEAQLAAIPRVGLNSAGSRKTDGGWAFDSTTYFGNPLAMPVLEDAGDWLKVMIPARPNGSTGWIKRADVELSSHNYRMELDLSNFHLTVFDGTEVLAETDVVIGKDQTYTPVGRFYINEIIEQSNPGGAYGPWILSTNGYSDSLDTFDGGLPVIAFHGTNQPELIGTQASNGCIRMPNDVVTLLAETLPAGTPVDILAGPAEEQAAA